MGERTVLASFYSAPEASKAAEQVHALGIEVAQVDELHGYSGVIPERRAFPITGRIPSLASLTLDTEVSSRDAGVLLAADPSASGMSGGSGNNTGARNYLLTVISPEDHVEQVVQIIKDCNGYT
jgi:hypothetical protein